jgi:predicted small integral membrane protein
MSYLVSALKWIADNRTKLIGYIGAAAAQLGVSGLVGQKTALWCAFVASVITLGIGHFNSKKVI